MWRNSGENDIKRSKEALRSKIWRLMVEKGVARPPFPVYGRIPNFKGAEKAAETLAKTLEWRRALIVKVNPDSPQAPVRLRALEEGKTLVMPTPRIREGFLLLDPKRIPGNLYRQASTIRGAFEYGVKLRTLGEILRALDPIDLIVEGSVVVNPLGERLGKGEGYGELEYAILVELNLIEPSVAIATTVHDIQVVEERIPQEPHDVPVDYIVTPTRTIKVEGRRERPPGILRDSLESRKLREIPLLRELLEGRV
ncbi:MAG: 5-formyltetrahydrofolate cyclo-ligase [Thermoprotei archaeon]|nr:5-formyltetrahydrofolate cyclo-ligase [Thermoprotei archaeon]